MILNRIIFGVILLADLHLASGVALGESCTDTCTTENTVCDSTCVCDEAYKEVESACVAKGLGDTCVAESDDCIHVDNSECTPDGCECLDGYSRVSDACEKALGDSCTTDGATCTTTNAVCAGGTCTCNEAYKEVGSACVAKGLGDTCSAESDDCNHVVNSECTSDSCACSEGFTHVDDACKQNVSYTDCTADGDKCPDNAMCESKKCKCDVGFTENADECVAESGASSTKAITGIVFGSMWILRNIMLIM